MNGPTHKLVGGCSAAVTAQVLTLDLPAAVVLVGVAALAGSLPDELEDWLPWLMPWRWRIRQGKNWGWRLYAKPLKHRKITHYPELAIPISAILLGASTYVHPFALYVVGGVVIGYLAHLLADAITVMGLPSLFFGEIHLLPRGLSPTSEHASGPVAVLVAVATAFFMAYSYGMLA